MNNLLKCCASRFIEAQVDICDAAPPQQEIRSPCIEQVLHVYIWYYDEIFGPAKPMHNLNILILMPEISSPRLQFMESTPCETKRSTDVS